MDKHEAWEIVRHRVEVFDKFQAYIYCDRLQDLLVYNQSVGRHTSLASRNSTASNSDGFSTTNVKAIIYLERIQYIQRGASSAGHRSARNYNELRATRPKNPTDNCDRQQRQLEIYYCADRPRSKYLYKHISFQLTKRDDEFEKWVKALYTVIEEAKNLDDAGKKNRWLLREYEKLRAPSEALTFDSINGWLNSHIGIVGARSHIENFIKEQQTFRESNDITYSVFKATYNHFIEMQQIDLIKIYMPNLFEEKNISLMTFASRINNKDTSLVQHELAKIKEYFKLMDNQKDITPSECINYLWSDANSVFDPISRTMCHEDMNQPLNHYWISSSHNTYLVGNQYRSPASVHCYIQALLKGCRCIEIDVFDSKTGAEPEVTHKNTRIKPIPLRNILETIHDYAFVTSDYPVIISIENHCSAAQRTRMAEMLIETFGEALVQSPLSPNETCYPSPNQLKRKILLKDTKNNSSSSMELNTDLSSQGLDGHLEIFDFSKQVRFSY
ncbi:unnamed protein product [Rotaria magnacalcarata]|uniref:Phosphoinositide phospholipase C n=1 Tax=Rotaria magnacalcarata TaxID=392030 RepID=A0A8S2MVH2_9BILA|nr:unnamed protein product [Rotaria magnacalcarata]CAF3975286.1 unnamed protein product [Rotaria magnacalcarata]